MALWESVGVENLLYNQAIRSNFLDAQTPDRTSRLEDDEHVTRLQPPPCLGLNQPIRWPNSLNQSAISFLQIITSTTVRWPKFPIVRAVDFTKGSVLRILLVRVHPRAHDVLGGKAIFVDRHCSYLCTVAFRLSTAHANAEGTRR